MYNEDEEENAENIKKMESVIPSHYVPAVRVLLFTAGIVLLLAILIDKGILFFYLSIGIIEVVTLMIFAAFTGKGFKEVYILDFGISLISFLIFEYFAVTRYYAINTFWDQVFLVRQTLAILFVLTVYFSTKTMIARILSKPKEENSV